MANQRMDRQQEHSAQRYPVIRLVQWSGVEHQLGVTFEEAQAMVLLTALSSQSESSCEGLKVQGFIMTLTLSHPRRFDHPKNESMLG